MRRLSKDMRIIYISLLLFSLATGLYSVIMPAYVRELGADSVQLGLLGSIAMAMATLSALPGGIWADRYELRTLMIIGWAMCLPTPIIYAFAPNWVWLIPGYFFFNFSMFCNAAMQAYIVSRTSPDERGFAFTAIHSSFSVGMVFAPTLGGYIAKNWGIRSTFGVSFVVYLLSTLALCWLSPNQPEAVQSKSWRLNPRLYPKRFWTLVLTFSAVAFVLNLPMSFNTPFLLDVAQIDLLMVGILGSSAAVGGALIAPLLGQVADKVGTWRVLGVCLLIIAVSYVSQVALPYLPVLLLSFLVRGGFNAMMSLMTALVSGVADRSALGMSFAMYNLSTGIAATLAPYTAGWMYGRSAGLPFMATAGFAALFGVWFIVRATKRGEKPCASPTP